MIHHIEFCLEEIEAELDAQGSLGLSTTQKEYLRQHVSAMRCMLTDWQRQPNSAILGSPTANNEISVSRDDLTLIRGVDSEIAAKLKAAGIDQYEGIANWTAMELRAFCSLHEPLSAEQISSENWVEQAAILASGNLTHYAQRVERGEYNCLTPIDDFQTQDSTARPASEDPAALLEVQEGLLDDLPREAVPSEAASISKSDDIAEVNPVVTEAADDPALRQTQDSTARPASEDPAALLEVQEGLLDDLPREAVPSEAASISKSDDIAEVNPVVTEAADDPALRSSQGNLVSLAPRNSRRHQRPKVQVAASLLLLAASSIAVHEWQLQAFSALARSLSP